MPIEHRALLTICAAEHRTRVRFALLDACRAHEICSGGRLSIALLSNTTHWLRAADVAAPCSDASLTLSSCPTEDALMVAQASEIAAGIPAETTVLEIIWLPAAGGPAPLEDYSTADVASAAEDARIDPAGRAVFCAMQCAQRRGLKTQCLIMAAEPQEPQHAIEQWAALLSPSDVAQLPASAEDAQQRLADIYGGELHWTGDLRIHGSTLSRLRLSPLPASANCGEAAVGRSFTSEGRLERWAEPTEAPAAGGTMQLVRLLREDQLPTHLRLRHVWQLGAAPSQGGRAAASFLGGWVGECADASVRGGADALLVRCGAEDPPRLLLLYARDGLMRAQLCAAADSLAGALRFLELQHTAPGTATATGIGTVNACAMAITYAPDTDSAQLLEWQRALPLQAAAALVEQLQHRAGNAAPVTAWGTAERQALQQLRYIAPRPAQALSVASDQHGGGDGVASTDATSTEGFPRLMPPPPSRQRRGEPEAMLSVPVVEQPTGNGCGPAASSGTEGSRACVVGDASNSETSRQGVQARPTVIGPPNGGSGGGSATSRGRLLASASGPGAPSAAASVARLVSGAQQQSVRLGLTMSDALRALRRVRERVPHEGGDDAASVDGSGRAQLAGIEPWAYTGPAEHLEAFEPPQGREHTSLLCMLLESGRLDFQAYAVPRRTATLTALPAPTPLPVVRASHAPASVATAAAPVLAALPSPACNSTTGGMLASDVLLPNIGANGDAREHIMRRAGSLGSEAGTPSGSITVTLIGSETQHVPTDKLVRRHAKAGLRAVLDAMMGDEPLTGEWGDAVDSLVGRVHARLGPPDNFGRQAPSEPTRVGIIKDAVRTELRSALQSGLASRSGSSAQAARKAQRRT